MYMAEFVEKMKGIRICPVLVIEDKNDAIPLGKALLRENFRWRRLPSVRRQQRKPSP